MLRVLQAQGKLVLQQLTQLPCNFLELEVSIHATCNNLICLNVGGKTQHSFSTRFAKQVARFCCPYYRSFMLVSLSVIKTKLNIIDSSFNRKQKIICETHGDLVEHVS